MNVRGVSVFSVGQQRPRFVEGILGVGGGWLVYWSFLMDEMEMFF